MTDYEDERMYDGKSFYVGARRSGKTTWMLEWLAEQEHRFIVVNNVNYANMLIKQRLVEKERITTPEQARRGWGHGRTPSEYLVDEMVYVDVDRLRKDLARHTFAGGTITGHNVVQERANEAHVAV